MTRHEETQTGISPLDWSVRLADIPEAGLTGERSAGPDELALLSRLLAESEDIEVKALTCRYELMPQEFEDHPDKAGVVGRFRVEARLRQTCVVTLEPVETTVDEAFEQSFMEDAEAEPEPEEVDHEDPFAPEPPLPIEHGRIVYGPLAYEYFAMGIDPNPRKPGVAFDEEEEAVRDRPPSPFAVLKKLQDPE